MQAIVDHKNEAAKLIPGGSFLIEAPSANDIFTPEELTDEHRMIGETTREFIDQEVEPHVQRLEAHDWNLARELLLKAAELGLLGANIPEEYTGLGLDQISGVVIAEAMGRSASFAVTFGSHTGIGALPILYFGSEEVKKKYLPKIVGGELIAAYALTEAGSGSDALAAKSTARLSPDGKHFILSGEKMWITNAGFADIFIVFAKVDGDKFSGFVVEKGEGVTTGEEEHKMGIKGSSTRALILQDVRVPVENLLGEIGQGAKIAFNILNFGRFKLGATCVGGMKLMLHNSIRYANERRQFGKAISEFGAIKTKLAEMAIRTWVGEAAVYRTVGLIQSAIRDSTDALTGVTARLRSAEEYAVECSIIKVSLSEFCGFVGDEMVQIYGGYGYSADYPAERAYRDMRINRIFEGTNEINRILISGMLMKRALAGRLELLAAAKALQDELLLLPASGSTSAESLLAKETGLTINAKKVALMILGIAAQKYMQALSDQQEILMNAADIIIDAYLMESAVLRAKKISSKEETEHSAHVIDMTRVFCFDAIPRIEARAKSTLAAMTEGDELRTMLAALQRLTKHTPINTIGLRHNIAAALIKANTYTF